MRRLAIVVVVLLAGFGIMVATVSPPGLLSILDAVAGGGWGASRPGSDIAFGTHGQTLDVWAPSEPSAKPRPVLIFWYGGGWVKGDRRAYAFAARAYAKAGFVVVVPDYRKVPASTFPAMLEDGAQAVKWVRDNIARYGGDTARIGVAGHSAGAYIAVMLALNTRWLVAEDLDPSIIRAAVGLSGPYNFYPFTSKRAIDAMSSSGDPWATQPIVFARADAPPMLLVTSTGDTEVKPHNAYDLAKALKRLGAPVEMIDYPALSHEDVAMALSKPFRGKGPVLADSVAFLNRTMPPH